MLSNIYLHYVLDEWFSDEIQPLLLGKSFIVRYAESKTSDWIKSYRHSSVQGLIKMLNIKLRGHYNYYGITFNSNGIYRYHKAVVELLFKWINRRGGKRVWNWKRYSKLIEEWQPILKPKIRQSYI